MAGSILGNRVLRKEDPKFLTTGGVYVDDLLDEPLLADAACVTYVRSTVAHGRIVGIDTSAALELPGVIGIYTAADLGLVEEPAAFNPAVTTVGSPFSGLKLDSLSPPHRKPIPFAPAWPSVDTLRANNTPLPFRSFWTSSSIALL